MHTDTCASAQPSTCPDVHLERPHLSQPVDSDKTFANPAIIPAFPYFNPHPHLHILMIDCYKIPVLIAPVCEVNNSIGRL